MKETWPAGADHTVGADGTYQETIGARRESRIADRTLISRRTPLAVGAFELVLVTQRSCGADADAGVINLQIVLVCAQLGRQFRFAQRRNGIISPAIRKPPMRIDGGGEDYQVPGQASTPHSRCRTRARLAITIGYGDEISG